MSVSGVSGSQQTGALTSYVKEQDQRAIAQRRTPDTLVGKNASSSCSFRYCFTRIYDFFCALFRCLFCIKNKPTKPNTEENEQTGKSAQSTQNKPTPNPAGVSHKDPDEAAYTFLHTKGPGFMSNDRTCQQDAVASLKAATTDFATLHPKVQDRVLWNMKFYLPDEFAYDALKAYLSKECLGERYDAFEQLGITVSSDNAYRLSKTFENGFGSTYVLPKESQKNPREEAADFFGAFKGHKGRIALSDALIAATEDFKGRSPKVQDAILHCLATNRFGDVLYAYLTDECLGAERNQAFLKAYGKKFLPQEAPTHRPKLLEIFQDGFGSTLSAAPVTQPKPEEPREIHQFKAPQPVPLQIETEEPSQPGLIFGEEAQAFMLEYKLYTFSSSELRDSALSRDDAVTQFMCLGRKAQEEILAFIEKKAGATPIYGFYKELHKDQLTRLSKRSSLKV